jgi:hypothetical protein
MVTDAEGRELHDRATRGLPLTEAEEASLKSWYESQDLEELSVLESTEEPAESSQFRGQLESAIEELPALSQRIQELLRQNEVLRRENAALRQKLASPRDTRAA